MSIHESNSSKVRGISDQEEDQTARDQIQANLLIFFSPFVHIF
jgi:hypothetical protein